MLRHYMLIFFKKMIINEEYGLQISTRCSLVMPELGKKALGSSEVIGISLINNPSRTKLIFKYGGA